MPCTGSLHSIQGSSAKFHAEERGDRRREGLTTVKVSQHCTTPETSWASPPTTLRHYSLLILSMVYPRSLPKHSFSWDLREKFPWFWCSGGPGSEHSDSHREAHRSAGLCCSPAIGAIGGGCCCCLHGFGERRRTLPHGAQQSLIKFLRRA